MGWHELRDADVPWGDYGRMLVSGMGARESDGIVAVERVGPFVPPVALCGLWNILVVTDEFRGRLGASGLSGFSFAQARKKRIVRIDWRSWDLAADEPQRYPAQNEPENYILGRKHDPRLADAIGPLWEVVIPGHVGDSHDDFARRDRWPYPIAVSDRAKEWLASQAGDWLSFEPLDLAEGDG